MLLASLWFLAWLLPLVAVTILALVFSIFFTISRVSGWPAWARRFPAGPLPVAGTTYARCGARVGKAGMVYSGVLTVTVSPAGVQVGRKLFHPALLLPWTTVRGVREGTFQLGKHQHRKLELACEDDGKPFNVYLPPEAAETVARSRPA